MHFSTTALGAFVALTFSAPSFSATIVRPFEASAQKYYQKLVAQEYDELDTAAAESRKSDLAISDGQSMLAAIYGGVAGCLSQGCSNRLTEAEWQQRLQLISKWREKKPNSVVAEVAQAKFYLEHAYAIRGQGYANTVKQDAWQLFNQSIETAYTLLNNAGPAAKQEPEWYATMLNVGVAQGWEVNKFNKIYAEAKRKSPFYQPVYFSASSYFSPRWHGSELELKKFIDDVVKTTEKKIGKTMYARLNWSLWTETMFQDGQTDWTQMKAGFERMTADYPDPWNINNFAKFACLAKDRQTVLKLADKIGDHPIDAAWWGSAKYYQQCVTDARLSGHQ